MLLAALILAATATPERCFTVDHRRVCAVGPRRSGLPLVFFLHGYGGRGTDDDFALESLARRGDFLYAYADGAGPRGEWTEADVPFLTRAIARLVAKLGADRRRVSLVGFSAGGFMALEYACAEPRRLAAAVSLAGTRFEPPRACRPGAVSILQIHGEVDDVVLPAGGVGRRTGRTYLSAAASAQIAATAAGCGALEPSRDPRLELRVQRASGCKDGARVEMWMLPSVGHAAPPTPSFPNQIWDFLSRARSPARPAKKPPAAPRRGSR